MSFPNCNYVSCDLWVFCMFQNEDRLLSNLGTLPPNLITFYNLTFSLNSSWHLLGLRYNPSMDFSILKI